LLVKNLLGRCLRNMLGLNLLVGINFLGLNLLVGINFLGYLR